ncbi:hypothetical protein HYW74_01020 [Candidatus Pacearchaeota archaeon]|nr:hypothetical protein [Candidatus Pacearchaeota archaeon]
MTSINYNIIREKWLEIENILKKDVSGYDMFKDVYVICIARDDGEIIRGFKFDKELVNRIVNNWKSNKYRYEYNSFETKRGIFKVRIYSIILYYLFKSIEKPDFLSLTICRDFKGRTNEITQSLKYFLETLLKIKMGRPLYQRLAPNSHAHIYANMMRRDNKNLLSTYVNISLEDIEKFLKKNKVHQGVIDR